MESFISVSWTYDLPHGVREQEANRLAVVCTPACFGQCRADVDGLNLIAALLLVTQGNSVAHNDAENKS